MEHLGLIRAYWWRVLRESAKRGLQLATGGPLKTVITVLTLVVGVGLVSLTGPAVAAGDKLNAAINVVMATALVFVALVLLGVVVVPPELDKLLRAERDSAIAKQSISAEDESARIANREYATRLGEIWDKGNGLLKEPVGSPQVNPTAWGASVQSWRIELMHVLADFRRTQIVDRLPTWPTVEEAATKPIRPLQRALGATLEVLAIMRREMSEEAIRASRDAASNE